MKFKVLKGTELFDKFQALQTKMKLCNKASFNLIEELGFKEAYGKSFVLSGGFYGLIPIDGKTKPDGYSWAFNDRQGNAVMPSKNLKKNKEILDKIKNLPVVEYSELNKLVTYKDEMSKRPSGKGNGTSINFCPEVHWKEKFILIDIPDYSGKYKPPKDMIEILESEYQKLSKKD